MPWVVGIDEAGYGPYLGPLVQAAVAVALPADDTAGWSMLNATVRRSHEAADHRLLIDDSKKVYSGSNGLAKLAAGVQPLPALLESIIASLGLAECLPDLHSEYWCNASTERGASAPRADLHGAFTPPAPVITGPRTVNVVQPGRFNQIVRQSGTKAAVTSQGVIDLIAASVAKSPNDDAMVFIIDKQGGRHFYAPLLQEAFPEGWIVAEREGALESRYRVMNLDRAVTVHFRPKADGDSMSVALASMLAKYLRELCMKQFNAFWAKHVPGLKPTAGYPVDAKRFFADIEPAMAALGIAKDDVWRMK